MASAAAEPGALNIAYVAVSDSFLWENIAYKRGLFQKYGVAVNEPVFVGGTPRLGAALVGGSFELAGVGFGAAVGADAAGSDLEGIAALSKYAAFSLILPPGSPIKDPKELKGKTIALSQIGDTADAFLTTLLEKNGLSRSADVKVIQAGSTANALASLLAKRVDAASVGNSDAFTGQSKGATILTNSRELNQLQPQGSVLVRKSWAQSHKPEVLGLLKSMLAALALYRSNQDQGLKLLQDSGWFKGVDPQVLALIYKEDAANWADLPLVDDAAVQAIVKLSAAANPAVSKLDPKSLYDNSYLQELVSDGFVKTVLPNYHG
ncbi:MAG TPA: ABC transporter substrate-binding protein [Chloroflexota bacterium]|nr:ABC transporter substrate-binding protein [Chloroflexota bacterium]